MSITDRDRKILMALIPIVLIGAYWFLLLAPKREEAGKIRESLSQAESLREAAHQKASQLAGAKASFSADYATVIRLGKSIPTSLDMPSLLVQLDRAARGTGIKFTDVKAGATDGAAPAPAPAPTNGTTPSPGAAPASGPGKAAQTANNAVTTANGAAPAGGAADPAAAGAAGTQAPGLESVPLDFEFRGSFFDLADFFHRMKRFVRVANNKIVVRGRLMTINSFAFDAKQGFPQIKATVSATVYLAPKAEGVSAGATPQGPAGSGPAGSGPQTASSPPSTPTPTAAVTAP